MTSNERYEVAIVGGGVAGLSAAIFTARHGFDTVVLDGEGSLLRRNAHLENYPGFPAGVNSRLFLELVRDQAERAGATCRDATVERIERVDEGDGDAVDRFALETEAGDDYRSTYAVAATKNAVDYLEPIDAVGIVERGKTFVDTDERGRTGVEGLYAAGRLAEKPHQTVIAAGHGAEVAVTLLEDDDGGFYHDWVAPEGYFTGRDREVPPGCEEIDEAERREREDESLAVMREYVAEAHPGEPDQHPSVEDQSST